MAWSGGLVYQARAMPFARKDTYARRRPEDTELYRCVVEQGTRREFLVMLREAERVR